MATGIATHLLAIAATIAAVAAVVGLHFEGLLALGRIYKRRAPEIRPPGRVRMLVLMGGMVTLHMAEIGIFGLAYWLVLKVPGTGDITGIESASLFDAGYLSAMTYSTVGFGDLAPRGPIRWLAGAEALVGLMMIAWSASFAFVEMSRHWDERDD